LEAAKEGVTAIHAVFDLTWIDDRGNLTKKERARIAEVV
jgi:hypothetical protein